jgi:hypothetical protein
MAERFAKYGGLSKKKKLEKEAEVIIKTSKAYLKVVREHKDRVARHKLEQQRQASVRKKRKSPMKS